MEWLLEFSILPEWLRKLVIATIVQKRMLESGQRVTNFHFDDTTGTVFMNIVDYRNKNTNLLAA